MEEKQKEIKASWNLERSFNKPFGDPSVIEQYFSFDQGRYYIGMYESIDSNRGWKLVVGNKGTGEMFPVTPEEIFKMVKK
jgi:hypothetical protein